MRDPKRITKISKLIFKIWRKNPDLRLGQLISNAVYVSDIFYIADHDLEKRLREKYNV